jgi:hypothetical protein
MVAAYEPTQALRDQIASLNASRPQGAPPFLSAVRWGDLCYIFFRFIASVRVKQEPVTQTQREPGDLDPIRFRSETYDPPKSSICEFQRKACHPTQPLISWIQDASPLSVKQEPPDVQASVAGPSRALWDEWSRYQSKQKMLNDSGMY